MQTLCNTCARSWFAVATGTAVHAEIRYHAHRCCFFSLLAARIVFARRHAAATTATGCSYIIRSSPRHPRTCTRTRRSDHELHSCFFKVWLPPLSQILKRYTMCEEEAASRCSGSLSLSLFTSLLRQSSSSYRCIVVVVTVRILSFSSTSGSLKPKGACWIP